MTKIALRNKLYDVLGNAINAYITDNYELAHQLYAEAETIYAKLVEQHNPATTLHEFLLMRCHFILNPQMHLIEIDHPVYQAVNFFEGKN